MTTTDLATILPRVLIVSRRSLRKNKFVDFVGEYHLDLIVGYGAVPVIVPRVTGVSLLLESFEPIHGVLLCEGEDIDPSLYETESTILSPEELEEIRMLHSSDTAIDKEKDIIELSLAKLCLERNIPYLGICRGSQVLNVACGGTLYQDIEKELTKISSQPNKLVSHIDYDNYDGHRHMVEIVKNTPLHQWFKDSIEEEKMEIMVNSYHHQGVKRLAQRFKSMAFAPDGLIEGFYDPDSYNPEQGKFIMGLQFHPERMRRLVPNEFDYPGCPAAYKEFVKAVVAYQKKLNNMSKVEYSLKIDEDLEKKRKVIVHSFSLARNIYVKGNSFHSVEESDLNPGAEFLESNTALSLQQENRLKQMGATVRNASSYMEKMKINEEREKLARVMMGKMRVEQLSDLSLFYQMMGKICSEVLDKKLQDSCSTNPDEFYTTCNDSFNCGNISGFRFPFRKETDPTHCGYPGFELKCNQDIPPTITIKNMTYRVQSIDPTTKIIKIIREDMIESICPQNLVNTTVDYNLFDYTSGNMNMSIIFGCPGSWNNLGIESISCSNKGDSPAFFIPGVHGPGDCETSVVVPVSVTVLDPNTVGRVVGSGFEVRWKVDDEICTGCRQSGGRCVYDNVTSLAACGCPKPHTLAGSCGEVNETRAVASPSSDEYPELISDPITYRVLEANLTGKSLVLARSDLWHNPCPTTFVNSSLNSKVFNAAGVKNVDLTIFFGCSLSPMTIQPPHRFYCDVGGVDLTDSYFLIGEVPIEPILKMIHCFKGVRTPLLRTVADDLNQSQLTLAEALTRGFQVTYTDPFDEKCLECGRSDGQCGFNITTGQPICVCNSSICSPPGSSRKGSVIIILSTLGAIFVSVGIAWGIFVCRQRKKRHSIKESTSRKTESRGLTSTTVSTFTSSISSYPSSKSTKEFGKCSYFGAQVFTFEELEIATDNFNDSRELGDGGYGTVYHGKLLDGREVAVKRLYENNFKRVHQFMNEIEILTKLQHKNLVKLYGCTSKRSRELLLVYEYIPNGTVADHLHGKLSTPNQNLFPWSIRLNIAIETSEALTYLHKSDIIHRDVKTNNILLDKNFKVKVADFGLSRLFPNNATHVSTAPQGTPGYVDPEYYQCYQLTDKSDVYSFGVVLIELISSLQAVDTSRDRLDINLAAMGVSKIQNHLLGELVDKRIGFESDGVVRRAVTLVAELAFRCLQPEADMRPTMVEVVEVLRGVKDDEMNVQKPEVVDIVVECGLFKGRGDTEPPSPEYGVTNKLVHGSMVNSSDGVVGF
ncbi:hypothetical protein LXL04_007062 [Taraxacum kok-saghyz]